MCGKGRCVGVGTGRGQRRGGREGSRARVKFPGGRWTRRSPAQAIPGRGQFAEQSRGQTGLGSYREDTGRWEPRGVKCDGRERARLAAGAGARLRSGVGTGWDASSWSARPVLVGVHRWEVSRQAAMTGDRWASPGARAGLHLFQAQRALFPGTSSLVS